MSQKTSIEWCDATWNPVRGCSRVSEGCRNCYAERQAARFADGVDTPFHGFVRIANGHPQWTGKVELVEKHLEDPLHWRTPKRVFVNSMSDLFHEALPDEAIDRVFAVMCLAHNHTYQILTKRPKRMLDYMGGAMKRIAKLLEPEHGAYPDGINWPPRWIWLGVSVEDFATADERIPLLLKTPAAVRFVSYEPALGPVDFSHFLPVQPYHFSDCVCLDCLARRRANGIRGSDSAYLDWIIVGGESGPGARSFDIQWARNTLAQCKAAGVACFYKQGGASNACPHDRKGGHFECFPLDLQVREFPRAI